MTAALSRRSGTCTIPPPFIRGIVAELGPERREIEYEQPCRRAGKTHNNLYTLYDAAMLSFTSYTKVGMRLATFLGFAIAVASFLVAMFYLVAKLLFWSSFTAGYAPMMIAVFFMGGVQLVFLGISGGVCHEHEHPDHEPPAGH